MTKEKIKDLLDKYKKASQMNMTFGSHIPTELHEQKELLAAIETEILSYYGQQQDVTEAAEKYKLQRFKELYETGRGELTGIWAAKEMISAFIAGSRHSRGQQGESEKELRLQLGLMTVDRDHTKTLLTSCEAALEKSYASRGQGDDKI